jgi:hypothetical protein
MRGEKDGQHLEAIERLEEYYRRRLLLLEGTGADTEETDFYTTLSQELRNIERAVANYLRADNQIHDEVLRTLERELDLADANFEKDDG